MEQLTLDFSKASLSESISDKKKRAILNHNLFKPPKFVHDFHYYTEVEKEWVQLGRSLED
jgi:hypothetical protein